MQRCCSERGRDPLTCMRCLTSVRVLSSLADKSHNSVVSPAHNADHPVTSCACLQVRVRAAACFSETWCTNARCGIREQQPALAFATPFRFFRESQSIAALFGENLFFVHKTGANKPSQRSHIDLLSMDQ
jgi:hypothetical protein